MPNAEAPEARSRCAGFLGACMTMRQMRGSSRWFYSPTNSTHHDTAATAIGHGLDRSGVEARLARAMPMRRHGELPARNVPRGSALPPPRH